METDQKRQRLPHGELKRSIRDFLASRNGQPASIKEITEGCKDRIGIAPSSSYRSCLQDDRYFERVERGVFKLRG